MAPFRALLLLAALVAAAAPRACGAEAAVECADIVPATKSGEESAISCEAQKGFKKCEAEWMLAGGFCALTCERCEPPPADGAPSPPDADAAFPPADDASPLPPPPAFPEPLHHLESAAEGDEEAEDEEEAARAYACTEIL